MLLIADYPQERVTHAWEIVEPAVFKLKYEAGENLMLQEQAASRRCNPNTPAPCERKHEMAEVPEQLFGNKLDGTILPHQ
ncbi:hypothetical protein JAK62_04470 [Stenotrophomonas maltophilia]|jgi:hypothetical protein|uniref:Uncharacterized protein n=2 Tax=Stenotrophomonas TaxID=40323 RepID=A0ABM7R2I2_9GAMM|nr:MULTISPECIES: hypothetical protein [Stenotrophomonas]MCV4213210.1 hypothetical protein [Pseudomonas cichorii]ELF4107123.1 hypothetical protein [Stenotrophomonas maltophilia]MBH1366932.1 hypothetical protein [Stenotrophomonas maltophilia]MBH1371079.1 hypothetical protein [Stenotrophomonas maltophilia]MBH1389845.1 hypothetical protein [Stenotrophomonas maltophilia]